MDKKTIKVVVLASYTKGELDSEKVLRIAKVLSRKDLKNYIHGLKNYEKKLSVTVNTPYELDNQHKNMFSQLYPDKKMIFQTNQSLILGLRITDNDTVYELDLQSQLNNILTKIEQDYDR